MSSANAVSTLKYRVEEIRLFGESITAELAMTDSEGILINPDKSCKLTLLGSATALGSKVRIGGVVSVRIEIDEQ
jgi:hypothetical protein